MNERTGVPLAELTTLRVGGPARQLLEAGTEAELIEVVRAADAKGEPLLVIGSGSNLVVSDSGFDGVVLRVASRGVLTHSAGDRLRLTVSAGEGWDELVAGCAAEGQSGIECLAGIPGLTGATPIQNVGAYGQEVAETIVSVRAYDRDAATVVDLSPAECGFGYRTSALKRSTRHVVLAVTFMLEPSPVGMPIIYPELARTLGVSVGERPPLAEVRRAVLALRRSKGMVLDPADPDSVSAGSFFLNPLVAEGQVDDVRRQALAHLGEGVTVPSWPQQDGMVKLSAAWLIERAGFTRGYGTGRAGISSKHALALVNRGGASATEVVALARELRDGVRDVFGVTLMPEPALIGIEL